MNLMLLFLLLGDTHENSSKSELEQNKNELTSSRLEASAQTDTPDMELLLFLGSWDDSENDQWLDPEIFAEDTQFNQQLDNTKAPKNEKDPDNP